MGDVMVRDGRFPRVRETLARMEDRAFEFAQTRSSFQIEKFIALDEHTPVTMYRHLSHNAHVMTTVLRDALLDAERLRRDLDARRAEAARWSGMSPVRARVMSLLGRRRPRDLDIEVYRLEGALRETEIKVKGLLQELDVFEGLCAQLERENGRPFTYKDFEDDQPEYWRRRLESQMNERRMGAQLGVGEGNYEAYVQAVSPPVLPTSRNVMRPFISVGESPERKEIQGA